MLNGWREATGAENAAVATEAAVLNQTESGFHPSNGIPTYAPFSRINGRKPVATISTRCFPAHDTKNDC